MPDSAAIYETIVSVSGALVAAAAAGRALLRPGPAGERPAGERACEDPVGPMSGYAVANFKAEFMSSDYLEGADFERLFDERLAEFTGAARRREVDVRMVAAAASVACQSSAAVLGSASLHEYAEKLRLSGELFAALAPVYVVGQNEPVDFMVSERHAESGYGPTAGPTGR